MRKQSITCHEPECRTPLQSWEVLSWTYKGLLPLTTLLFCHLWSWWTRIFKGIHHNLLANAMKEIKRPNFIVKAFIIILILFMIYNQGCSCCWQLWQSTGGRSSESAPTTDEGQTLPLQLGLYRIPVLPPLSLSGPGGTDLVDITHFIPR